MATPKLAVLLAGGFGTRLKELTKETPKPLLHLQGKPIMWYTVELCRRQGITRFLFSVHHFKEQIMDYWGDGSKFGISVEYIVEDEPLGTGGCLRLAADKLTEPFVLANADELKDIDLDAMAAVHERTGALATDALFRAEDPSAYGTVELAGNLIKRFVEKPAPGTQPSNWCNAGLYILDPQVLSYIKPGFTMVEKELFPRLAAEGKMAGYCFSGQWFDTGTPERYRKADAQWKGFSDN